MCWSKLNTQVWSNQCFVKLLYNVSSFIFLFPNQWRQSYYMLSSPPYLCYEWEQCSWTTRSLSSSTFPGILPCTVYILPQVDFLKCITSHLSGLKSIANCPPNFSSEGIALDSLHYLQIFISSINLLIIPLTFTFKLLFITTKRPTPVPAVHYLSQSSCLKSILPLLSASYH